MPSWSSTGRPRGVCDSVETCLATTRSLARTAAGELPVTSTVNAADEKPGNRSCSVSITRTDGLPGTSQPPPVRWSLCRSENDAPAASSTSHTPTTARRRRDTSRPSRASATSTAVEPSGTACVGTRRA